MFPNAENGLNYPLFRMVAFLVPMVNVELAIINTSGEILLTYRRSSPDIPIPGWHLPGGIVRVGERLQDRIKKTAETEVGFRLTEERIVAMSETLIPKKMSRRHFISFLVICRPKDYDSTIHDYSDLNKFRWFKAEEIPADLISNHSRYRAILKKLCQTGLKQFKSILVVEQSEDFTRHFDDL